MADEIRMTIGSAGGPPTTEYVYSLGSVSMSARASTSRTATEFDAFDRRIDNFVSAVNLSESAPPTYPTEPFMFRAMDDNAAPGTRVLFRFRSGALRHDAYYVYATKLVHEEPDNAVMVPWPDFLRFVTYLHTMMQIVRSCPL